MGLSLDQLASPVDDIAFLSGSNHRVAVLRELADADRTRRELREATGASRPTLGRILEAFTTRGWIARDDDTYGLTPLGRLLTDSFTELMDSVELIKDLNALRPQLPLDVLDFDLRLLREAEITIPSPADATAHVRREEELAARADRIRFFCNSAHPHTVAVYRDRVVDGDQRLEAVIAAEAMAAAADDPEMGPLLADILASDRSTIYRYDGHVPVMVGLLGETAVIQPLDEAGVPCALIESDADAIREWVDETIRGYQAEATMVTAELLDG